MAVKSVSEIIEKISPFYKKKGEPSEEHKIVYDSSSETLEPVYFWILDMVNSIYDSSEKLVDNFVSTPGSGHFAELGARATRMQEEGMKLLGAVNTVLKSVINLIYDLKEFEIRLKHYDALHSKDKNEREAGLLAIKQVWMDNVDIKRGRGSINMLAQDLNFVTLRDAFMIAKTLEEIDKMDLNDRVKRILKPRLQEFLEWKTRSERELRKRYEIEKTYLKSQVSSLKLYTRWAKPYLKAAEELRQKETGREPELVKVFNSIVLELVLLGKSKINIQEAAVDRDLPESFGKIKLKRDYYRCVIVDFFFRGIPQRVGGQQPHFAFGGRVEVSFKAYALNQDELDVLNEKLAEEDISDAMKLVSGVTDESLIELKEDIEYFLKTESEKQAEETEKSNAEDINPFSALIGIGGKKFSGKEKGKTKAEIEEEKEKAEKKEKIKNMLEKGIPKDNYIESVIRAYTEEKAKKSCYTVFDIYKKAHDMASAPSNPYE